MKRIYSNWYAFAAVLDALLFFRLIFGLGFGAWLGRGELVVGALFCKGPNPSRRSLVNPRLNRILKCEAYRSRNSADMVQREKRTQLVNAAPALCLLFPGPPCSTHWPFWCLPHTELQACTTPKPQHKAEQGRSPKA